jgi:translation elongation factor EF-1alpha
MATKKKVVKKKAAPKKKVLKKKTPAVKPQKPIGVITHFYGKIKVGIFKFNKPVKVGTEIKIRGAHTDFTQKITSMQLDHEPVTTAKKGKQIGIKVAKKVHEGDQVFPA